MEAFQAEAQAKSKKNLKSWFGRLQATVYAPKSPVSPAPEAPLNIRGPCARPLDPQAMTIANKKKILTLLFVQDGDKVLLGMKRRGFGQGKYNGFGGKVEQGETIEKAAMRELQEEACITASALERMGLLWFTFEGDDVGLEVHVFRAVSYFGVPEETEEMTPQWFPIDQIPYEQMWPDDKLWLPWLLQSRKFVARFDFLSDQKTIVKEFLKEVAVVPESFDPYL
ncbi:uncharacterized protein VTP21DRAFT_7989 [Calcarisporiella thermophila]|uniref:uncharacterized protein n=1 Tax=Calcarisporiella thermophila TaxID=911321 RepID=UPI003744A4EF